MNEDDLNSGLVKARLKLQTYKMPRPGWDHDLCEFCFAKFMEPGNPNTLHQGYYCESEDTWICPKCYEARKAEFQWTAS